MAKNAALADRGAARHVGEMPNAGVRAYPRAIVDDCFGELADARLDAAMPPIGIMVETPAAAIITQLKALGAEPFEQAIGPGELMIPAIRGLGGYHLACDATSEFSVLRLRARKARDQKPLAVMVVDVADAAALCHVGPVEREILTGAERPIVLLRARDDSGLAPSVSPGLDTAGVMLAYTPLHLLLLEGVGRPLVMTSGNLSELPICTANAEASRKLADVADGFLMHDRDIVARYDDSVIRVMNGAPAFIRRARGYAPLPVGVPVSTPRPLLAVGPHLKNTFSLVTGDVAFVSQHVGDLENVETLDHYREALLRFQALFSIEPEVVARDLHPGYLSTRIADEMGLDRVIGVQHHHAHIAAVAGEHGVLEPVVGIAYDGTGYGDDGHTWGAELLLADLTGYRRLAQLRYAPMPGADLAARTPWRMAAGYASLEPELEASFAAAFDGVAADERRIVAAQIDRGVNAPLASSMGRLFDAAAAVLGVRRGAAYEGQAAMELEALARRWVAGSVDDSRDPSEVIGEGPVRAHLPRIALPVNGLPGETAVMDPVPLLAELGARAAAGEDAGLLAELHDLFAEHADQVVDRFYDHLCRFEALQALLADPDITSARLVMNPEKMVIDEARACHAPTSMAKPAKPTKGMTMRLVRTTA